MTSELDAVDEYSEVMVKLVDVRVEFPNPSGTPTTVLQSVSIDIPRGSFTVIHGPSGSGKSTMLNAIVGLQGPTGGKVIVSGVNLYELGDDDRANFRATYLGLMFQTNYWLASLPIIENVAMPLILAGASRREARDQAQAAIASIGMSDFENYMPSVLSVGQQQRFSMLRATITSPALLVADEPTGNLDTANGDLIMNLLSEIHAAGTTVMLVTHNPDYVAWGTHSVEVRDGKVTRSEVAGTDVRANEMVGAAIGAADVQARRGSILSRITGKTPAIPAPPRGGA